MTFNPNKGDLLATADKNECSLGAHTCVAEHGFVCQNTEGGYDCVCPEAHTLNAKLNRCLPNTYATGMGGD